MLQRLQLFHRAGSLIESSGLRPLNSSSSSTKKTISLRLGAKYRGVCSSESLQRDLRPVSRKEVLRIGLDVLRTACPMKKSEMTLQIAKKFDRIEDWAPEEQEEAAAARERLALAAQLPDFPARPEEPRLVSPNEMTSHHVEVNAIDTAWDTLVRFDHVNLPLQFYKDWISMAADEAKHFTLLEQRLRAHGSRYGALPAHAIIWNIASKTKDNILERIAVMQMVEEPRGLDAWDRLVERLRGNADHEGSKLVNLICSEEVRHVQLGVYWFNWICERDGVDPVARFHEIIRKVKSPILPPFNEKARNMAGLSSQFYVPVSRDQLGGNST